MTKSPLAFGVDRVFVRRETPVTRSVRVMQLEGLMDVPPREANGESWTLSLPLDAQAWQVGLIVGPSGAGKTTVARELWGEPIGPTSFVWPEDASILDAFPEEMGIKEIVVALSSVGFGSPPAWLRPYRSLSTGEQFRVSMARALATFPQFCVVDEFTSVVDRQVAQIAAAAVAKHVRRGDGQFVALSCHYDIVDWLQPDWIYQPHLGKSSAMEKSSDDILGKSSDDTESEKHAFHWRSVQPRPPVELTIAAIDRAAWPLFAPHHYLSHTLAKGAHCFGGWVGDELVGFVSYIHFPHPKTRTIKMAHRLVVLPDWQGVGIAKALADWMGAYLHERGYRLHFVISHPAMAHMLARSHHWDLIRSGMGVASGKRAAASLKAHQNRFTVRRMQRAFEYVP